MDEDQQIDANYEDTDKVQAAAAAEEGPTGAPVVEGTFNDSGDQLLPTYQPTGDGAADMITLTNLIQNYLVQIDRSQKEMQKYREMLEDSFMNDPTYREQNDKVKEAMKVRNATKAQIMKLPSVVEVAAKVKDMKESLSEARESLSGYLQEYARITGEQTIEDSDGEIRQIVYTAKLIKIGAKQGKK